MHTLTAGCKVNLGLRITGRRHDGYHEIDSLFWPLPHPHDRLEITFAGERGLAVHCSSPDFPASNTLSRAYELFLQEVGTAPALRINLHKGIPQGAGLGGGSSDAAALLKWLNMQQKQPLPMQKLTEIAARVGADTPFFLQDKACRVRGIGELLQSSSHDLAGIHLVLVCPDIHVSTAWAFAAYDRLFQQQNDLTKRNVGAKKNVLSEIQALPDLHNDLEAVVLQRHPQLAAIKTQMLHMGADAVGMSGSGSSMLGLFVHEPQARNAAELLRREKWRVFAHVL
jgi:4-diphosphocytidyl-2-C-methyl-D-erythritol kinase